MLGCLNLLSTLRHTCEASLGLSSFADFLKRLEHRTPKAKKDDQYDRILEVCKDRTRIGPDHNQVNHLATHIRNRTVEVLHSQCADVFVPRADDKHKRPVPEDGELALPARAVKRRKQGKNLNRPDASAREDSPQAESPSVAPATPESTTIHPKSGAVDPESAGHSSSNVQIHRSRTDAVNTTHSPVKSYTHSHGSPDSAHSHPTRSDSPVETPEAQTSAAGSADQVSLPPGESTSLPAGSQTLNYTSPSEPSQSENQHNQAKDTGHRSSFMWHDRSHGERLGQSSSHAPSLGPTDSHRSASNPSPLVEHQGNANIIALLRPTPSSVPSAPITLPTGGAATLTTLPRSLPNPPYHPYA